MTLTELWKDGQLEDGFYYFRLPDGSIDIASEYRLIRYRLTKDADKIKVLAPVPSYEEWTRTKDSLGDYKRLCDMRGKIIDKMDESNEDTVKHLRQENAQLIKFLEEFNALDVAKENQQLKDLLWSCQAYFNNQLNDNWAKSIIMDIGNAIGEKK